MASLFLDIKAVVLRGQFLAALVMFLSIALMVMQNDITTRALLLVPVVLFYYLSKILFAREQQERVDRIIEKVKSGQ
jgi:Sec-independent protein secretion pathway component TatC